MRMKFHETCVVDTEGYFNFVDNDGDEQRYYISKALDTYQVDNKPVLTNGKWNSWDNTSNMNYVIVKFVDDHLIFYDENYSNITEYVHSLTNIAV